MILEFNRSDRFLINSLGSIFTISLEFELETDDKKNGVRNPKRYLEISKNNAVNYIKDNIDKHENEEDLIELVVEILENLELTTTGEDDDSYNIEIFEEYIEEYEGSFEGDLIQVLYSDYLTYWSSDNIDYLTKKVKKHLPKFFNKWSKLLKFEIDNTLKRGIEFSLSTYIRGIEKTAEIIDDFYEEFEMQNYWYMSKRTGIHINIGVDYKADWNILKGFLMISDEGEQSFAFKDMEWRQKSMYTQTFLPILKKDIETNRERVMKHSQFQDLKSLEEFFSDYIINSLKEAGYKNYGFNITRTKRLNYVEFRYPGGEISKNILIDKLYYFCYIVHLMTDENYKRKDYLKKLYKFISSI
jgi:hypothetical protein